MFTKWQWGVDEPTASSRLRCPRTKADAVVPARTPVQYASPHSRGPKLGKEVHGREYVKALGQLALISEMEMAEGRFEIVNEVCV